MPLLRKHQSVVRAGTRAGTGTDTLRAVVANTTLAVLVAGGWRLAVGGWRLPVGW
jgi:hypothetical protein